MFWLPPEAFNRGIGRRPPQPLLKLEQVCMHYLPANGLPLAGEEHRCEESSKAHTSGKWESESHLKRSCPRLPLMVFCVEAYSLRQRFSNTGLASENIKMAMFPLQAQQSASYCALREVHFELLASTELSFATMSDRVS